MYHFVPRLFSQLFGFLSIYIGSIEFHVIHNRDALRQQERQVNALRIPNTHMFKTQPSERQKERDWDIL
jgi:hypothetical protein